MFSKLSCAASSVVRMTSMYLIVVLLVPGSPSDPLTHRSNGARPDRHDPRDDRGADLEDGSTRPDPGVRYTSRRADGAAPPSSPRRGPLRPDPSTLTATVTGHTRTTG